jgi:hypothetical protein
VAQRDGRLVEMYLFAALVYFVISFVASLLVRRLQSGSRSSAEITLSKFEFDRLDWSACGDWYMIDGLDLPEDVEMTDW